MGTPDRLTFGRLLRTHRTRERLTQTGLGARSGYSADYISKLERGERTPPVEAFESLSAALGLDDATRSAFLQAWSQARGEAPTGQERPVVGTPMPTQVTSFVGRQAELDTLGQLLRTPGRRLVTLTGPGGIGKTRLAVRLGELVAPQVTHGVWFVPLAAVTDPDHLVPAIATAVGVVEAGGVTLADSLVRHIGEGDYLLVLDNTEQLRTAAAVVGDLLDRCPNLQVVAASRASLQLAGEQRFEVPPLAVPTEVNADLGVIAAHPAVQLFVDRARAVRPEFVLDTDNAADVVAVCSALDGLPLALELAAARVRLFPPRALRGRLSSRLALLAGGPVDRPPRQQTMRAAIDWSFQLLGPSQRRLFTRLSVFAGGASLDAVEAVSGPDSEPDVVSVLESLIDQSLVQQDGDTETRVAMLDTIREFALERLVDAGAGDDARACHAAFYSAFVAELSPRLAGAEQDQAERELGVELDNVRAALTWLLEHGRVEEQLTMASVFAPYQLARGSCSEAALWVERGLGAGVPVTDRVLRAALLALGEALLELGDLDRAEDVLTAAQRLCDRHDDRTGVGTALNRRAVIACRRGDYRRAVLHAEQAMRTAAADRRGRAYALVTLGTVATHLGDRKRAHACLTEAVELYRVIGSRTARTHALINLGYEWTLQGRYAEAEEIFAGLVVSGRDHGLKRSVGYALENLGNIGILRGDLTLAAERLREGLTVAWELNDQHLLLYLFTDLIKLETARGRYDRAAVSGGVVAALRARLGLSMVPAEDECRARALDTARVALGASRYEAAHGEGATTTLEDVVRDAVRDHHLTSDDIHRHV